MAGKLFPRDYSAFSLYGPPVPQSFLDLVECWSAEQVADWLRGLDDCVLPYVHFFTNAHLDGVRLLMLTHGELQDMGISSLGVRQVIAQAVDVLCHLCYSLDTENLQSLAMQVGVKAKNFLNDLRWIQEKQGSRHFVAPKDTIALLNTMCTGVSYLIEEAKKIISWLDRSPFDRMRRFVQIRNKIMEFTVKILKFTQVPSVDMLLATKNLINLCCKLYNECNTIVTDINDPLVLQTAFLERAVLRRKKPEQDLGFDLLTSYKGSHMITEVKYKSPADICGKVDAGDEIVQFNGQTVIGWDLKKLVTALNQYQGVEVSLLLKKRPREFTIAGYRSQPGTPRMAPKRNVGINGESRLNLTVKQKTESTSSADSPGPISSVPRRLKKKDRKKSSSFTSIPQTPTEKQAAESLFRDPGTPPRKLTVPVKLEAPDFSKIFSSGMPRLEFEEEEPLPPVNFRQRRASVSGGSPIFKRMSTHLGRTALECPRPQSQWVEVMRDASFKQKSGLLSPSEGGVIHSSGVRRKKMARVPVNLRPISFIDNQLILPPPARVSLVSSTASSTDSEMEREETKKGELSSDDDVFLTDGDTSIIDHHTPIIRPPVRNEDIELNDFASIEVADLEELQMSGMGTNFDPSDWLASTSRAGSDSGSSSGVRVLTEQELDYFYRQNLLQTEAEAHRNDEDVINGNIEHNKQSGDWSDPVYEGIDQIDLNRNNSSVNETIESIGTGEDLETSFVSSTMDDADSTGNFSVGSFLSTDSPSRRKIEKFFGELPSSMDREKLENTPISASTSGNWSILSSTSGKIDLIQGSSEKFRGELAMGERNSPVLTGVRAIGSTHRREVAPAAKSCSEPMLKMRTERAIETPPRGSRVDWKTLELLANTPCARVMTCCNDVMFGWVKRAKLPGELSRHGAKWHKLWMVLAGGTLYMYKRQEDETAECVLWLPEFIACPAEPEYRTSKKNVFKLYDAETTFYFSVEDKPDMYRWLKKLGLAAISYGSQRVSRGSKKGVYYFAESTGKRDKRDRLSESPQRSSSIFGTLPRAPRGSGKSRGSPSAGEIFSSLRKSLRTASPRNNKHSQLSRENSTGSTKSADGRHLVMDPLKPRKISTHSGGSLTRSTPMERERRGRIPEEFRHH